MVDQLRGRSWVSTEENVEEEEIGPEGGPEEVIAGRTTEQEFQTFFDQKTFGQGEAGEAWACLGCKVGLVGRGLVARTGPLQPALLRRLWAAAAV